jgi:hypothetical protein
MVDDCHEGQQHDQSADKVKTLFDAHFLFSVIIHQSQMPIPPNITVATRMGMTISFSFRRSG